MAKIHGISGSTRYLLNGTRPINGIQWSTLEEINTFYSNFKTVLAGIEEDTAKRHDQRIADTRKDELQLDQQIRDGIAQRTIEVNRHILEINGKIEASRNIFRRSWYKVQFWGACALCSYRIHSHFSEQKNQLEQLRHHRNQMVAGREQAIRNECRSVLDNHEFLKQNETFLIGAIGEEDVIRVLSGLPDAYHILNDVNIRFRKAVYWKRYRKKIRTCQIDHIVIGPSGLYLLETKNWKRSDIQNKSGDLAYQVNKANYMLWRHLKENYRYNETPSIRNVVVSMQGSPTDQRIDPYITVLSPDRLCRFLTKPPAQLSEEDIHALIHLIPCREVP
jgi:hypothetical protein